MKLYRVEVKEVLCVVARNDKDVEQVLDECDWGAPCGEKKITPIRVKTADEIPKGWKMTIPIGRSDDNPKKLTCDEIVDPEVSYFPLQPVVVTVLEPRSEKAKVDRFKRAIEKLAKEMDIRAKCED